MSDIRNEKTGASRSLRAEIIAIGDELVGGVRVDTNSQWISRQLDQLGIQTAFHSTVGDDLADMLAVFRSAAMRADLIITTGGLGPTADDLTRNVIAELGQVELELDPKVMEHIQQMYHRRGRVMPPNNEVQAWFPAGANIVANPEGTAPGIEFAGEITPSNGSGKMRAYRIFAFPGVPAELKQMWNATVESRIRSVYKIDAFTVHHTVHCFGLGESAVEMQLPDLIERGRDPLVGITASAATISLRVATRGSNADDCKRKIEPTVAIIKERLGDLVYGENGQQLEDAVAKRFAYSNDTISIFDWGLRGEVARRLSAAEPESELVVASRAYGQPPSDKFDIENQLGKITSQETWHENATSVLVISPIDRDPKQVSAGESYFKVGFARRCDGKWQRQQFEFRFIGHSSWREVRAVKDVLNALRLIQ